MGAEGLPVAAALVDEHTLTEPHRNYPASDLPVPIGTPVFAMVDGTIATAVGAAIYPIDRNR